MRRRLLRTFQDLPDSAGRLLIGRFVMLQGKESSPGSSSLVDGDAKANTVASHSWG